MVRKVLVAEAVEERDFQLAKIQRMISDTNFAKYIMKGNNPLKAYGGDTLQKQFQEVYDSISEEIDTYIELYTAIYESDAKAEVVIDDKQMSRATAMSLLKELTGKQSLTHMLVNSVQEQLKTGERLQMPGEVNYILNTSLDQLQEEIKKLRIAIKISNATTFIEVE